MAHLIVSTIAALAMAMATHDATGSLLLAFLAYSATGTLVLLAALVSAAFDGGAGD